MLAQACRLGIVPAICDIIAWEAKMAGSGVMDLRPSRPMLADGSPDPDSL